ncbi:hypothetical protein K0J45_15720 [Shewanella alkalitolerans]|uniref:hypothetical protein n=1 Tax=Shewanella alkalitolerans TaxID=2864209 RepID=UPI001C65AEE5|nr:hypothetical protein [Shewanella alkalitolerans]QYJ96947.1 hypothetical protein K0J45_15720 [Shewanella alkalitolerans]
MSKGMTQLNRISLPFLLPALLLTLSLTSTLVLGLSVGAENLAIPRLEHTYLQDPHMEAPCTKDMIDNTANLTYRNDAMLESGQEVHMMNEIELTLVSNEIDRQATPQISAAKFLSAAMTLSCDSDCDTMDGLNRHAGQLFIAFNRYLANLPQLNLVSAKDVKLIDDNASLFIRISQSKAEITKLLAEDIESGISEGKQPIVYVKLLGEHGLVLHLKLMLTGKTWLIAETIEEGLRSTETVEDGLSLAEQLPLINFSQSEYEVFHQNRPWAEHFVMNQIRLNQCWHRTIAATRLAPDGTTTTQDRDVVTCDYQYR